MHVPALMAASGFSAGTFARMAIVFGANPVPICAEAAFAKLRGVLPSPVSGGRTIHHRPNTGRNRRAYAALHRVAAVDFRRHHLTIAHARRRTGESKSAREIRLCLKRYIAREICRLLCDEPPTDAPFSKAS